MQNWFKSEDQKRFSEPKCAEIFWVKSLLKKQMILKRKSDQCSLNPALIPIEENCNRDLESNHDYMNEK